MKGICVCVVLRNLEERVEIWVKQNLTNIFFFNEFNSEKERIIKQTGKLFITVNFTLYTKFYATPSDTQGGE